MRADPTRPATQVVAAGVHEPSVGRRVGEVEVLGDWQGVHVSAQQDDGARPATGPDGTAAEDRHH